jgi:hypothetical protein
MSFSKREVLADSDPLRLFATATPPRKTSDDDRTPYPRNAPTTSTHHQLSIATGTRMVLEHAGLITRGRRAQFQPCIISAAALAEVAGWAEQYRHIWDNRFDRMDDYVRNLQATTPEKEG